jgi:hypothetical protein
MKEVETMSVHFTGRLPYYRFYAYFSSGLPEVC